MKKEIICTVCPMGCQIQVEGEGENISSVSGFGCKRGEEYASSEFCHPVRILTTTIKVLDGAVPLIPVRSEKPLPKERIMECMEVIRKAEVKVPISTYDVLVENICGTGINIVATASVK